MSKAKTWVEENFPSISGNHKAMLILAYGAGLDEGLKEAQEIFEQIAKDLKNAYQIH